MCFSYSFYYCFASFPTQGALLFGLDVGITGGVLAMPSFLEMFFPDTFEAQQNHTETNAYCSYDSQVSMI